MTPDQLLKQLMLVVDGLRQSPEVVMTPVKTTFDIETDELGEVRWVAALYFQQMPTAPMCGYGQLPELAVSDLQAKVLASLDMAAEWIRGLL